VFTQVLEAGRSMGMADAANDHIAAFQVLSKKWSAAAPTTAL